MNFAHRLQSRIPEEPGNPDWPFEGFGWPMVLCGAVEHDLFKDRFGVAPSHYASLHRVRLARRMLQSGAFSVEDISRKLGYPNPARFVRTFRRQAGVAPDDYLRIPFSTQERLEAANEIAASRCLNEANTP